MVSKKFVIRDPKGLHLRPATDLCNEAIEFKSSVKLIINHITADAKSVLGVLAAGVKCGMTIEISCNGPDEEIAMEHLTEFIAGSFGQCEKE